MHSVIQTELKSKNFNRPCIAIVITVICGDYNYKST